MLRGRAAFIVALGALVVAGVGGAASKRAALSAPSLVAPAAGAGFQALPAFGWRGVGGADHYEFEISADASFNSPVLGRGRDSFATRNTWATLDETIPNGKYWWHVRAVSKSGGVSGWSRARTIRKQWSYLPRLLSPSSGAEIRFPMTPLVLGWSPVAYAAKYLVYLATDRDLGTLVGGKPIETAGVTYSPSVTLAIGNYYWAVTPVDAEGNRGERSRTASFRWVWRSQTTPSVRDLVAAQEHHDPQFSWKAVAGAARYEIEINPSHEWAIGSKVCCRDPVLTTKFAPTQLLANNQYYWRVRAINVDGNAGRWNEGPSFTKVFDNVEGSQLAAPSVKSLHLRDNAGDGGPKPAGWSTPVPVVVWDPVPGASGYQVDVAPFSTPTRPNDCDWTARGWQVDTAVPAWTPLAPRHGQEPYPARNIRATDDQGRKLVAGQAYCVRVRARTDRDAARRDVFGDYTYLSNAFRFAGYAAGFGSPNATSNTYFGPIRGTLERQTPLFTWASIPGAASYWVLVSKDPSFTTVVDYALTNVPAYAPRRGQDPMTYTDEQTLYYWAVLPASKGDGAGAPGDPLSQLPANFKKLSQPPTIVQPERRGQLIVGPPTFRWTPALGARDYRLQVSQDRNFGNLLDDVVTDSTSYSASKTYPANSALYVRVRAEDENEVGLTWSTPRAFRDTLARPALAPDNAASGDLIPTWVWRHVQGALSYDVHVDLPNGTDRDFSNDLLTAFTATKMTGTGVFRWQVRAEFPEARGGKTAVGPYTRPITFTRTTRPPSGARAAVGGRSVLLSWQPKIGADHYLLQIATSPDFGHTIENERTDNTSFAPDFRSGSWSKSTVFYWRVAAVDADNNSGNYTPVRTFRVRIPNSR